LGHGQLGFSQLRREVVLDGQILTFLEVGVGSTCLDHRYVLRVEFEAIRSWWSCRKSWEARAQVIRSRIIVNYGLRLGICCTRSLQVSRLQKRRHDLRITAFPTCSKCCIPVVKHTSTVFTIPSSELLGLLMFPLKRIFFHLMALLI